ncbi:glycosyltransferase family 4 protein [Sporosarcina aquimarina]|uniref:glycosyltransferase family 4 protein n=1 Tax=Sporosarcina aquimarina TaxID=114975 RepID=UPI00203ED1F2|nr:glycosyltransferase family 4 protein [Sporosarcina aquimarina]MCM3756320.1 glycosyltransferase family 4 protein [Sporosarcina aquimarina]
MRVIFLRSNPVDPDSRVEKEVNSLVKAGYEVEILAWDRSSRYTQEETFLKLESGSVKIYRFGIPASYGGGMRKNLWPLMKFQIRVFNWLVKNKKRYDIIHACDFDTAFISSKVAKQLKKKFVYDIFDYYVDAFGVPKKMKKYIVYQDHHIINTADAVIVCTDKRREQIEGTSPIRLAVIHNTPAEQGVNFRKLNLNPNRTKLVYVGILGKGRFIREIVEIVKRNPQYEFHVGGFGEYEQYLEEVAKECDNIFFYGKLPYHRTLELENSCDIMIAIYDPQIPNHYYAAPNKFYESLMLGKPLIMVKKTGMDDLVAEHDIGNIIEYNMESLEDAVGNLVVRKSEWDNISTKMKNLYKDKYSWGEMEVRLINLYKDL